LLARLLDNLLANAARFAPLSSVELVAEGRDLAVIDHGPGVPARQRDLVFDRFYRGRRDEGQGSGLGLAICRGIMEAHGGAIRHEVTVGGGATFVCSFPMSRGAALPSAAGGEVAPGDGRPRSALPPAPPDAHR
jgi:two-component system sensor histidine kinase TctE